jgi:hypothetical protein
VLVYPIDSPNSIAPLYGENGTTGMRNFVT